MNDASSEVEALQTLLDAAIARRDAATPEITYLMRECDEALERLRAVAAERDEATRNASTWAKVVESHRSARIAAENRLNAEVLAARDIARAEIASALRAQGRLIRNLGSLADDIDMRRI